MPIITTPLKRNDTGQAVADLQAALLKLGSPIADTEKTAKRFGDSTLAAVIDLRRQFGLPDVNGNLPPFDASVGRLLNVAAAANDGNLIALRSAVRESVAAAASGSPQENARLAQFAVIAGLYPAAQTAAARAPQLTRQIGDIITVSVDVTVEPKPPEVAYPENFYTYRYKLVWQEKLDELRALAESGSSSRSLRRRMIVRDGEGDWPDRPDEVDPEPPPSTQPDPARRAALIESADSWLQAVNNWQFGNEEFRQQRYASAVSAYTACQKAALNYFNRFYGAFDFTRGTVEGLIDNLVVNLAAREPQWRSLWAPIKQRRLMLSLEELGTLDWTAVNLQALSFLETNLTGAEVENSETFKALRQRALDRPLLLLASVFARLARAEANALRGQYNAAEIDLRRVLSPYTLRGGETTTPRLVWLTCDFIEIPFARLLLAETLLNKADSQYKARTRIDIKDPVPVEALKTAAVEYKTRFGDPHDRNKDAPFQLHEAAISYLSVFELFNNEVERGYVTRVTEGLNALNTELNETAGRGDVKSKRFQRIGNDITVPTIEAVGDTLPGFDPHVAPHAPLIRFEAPAEPGVMRETNPRVYAALLQAQARLVQLWSWFNYIGYSDDYVPPWRFQYLLERARYFSEHAKNAERDYLNFLSNAEHEEFQELSASQNVELEKSNVRIETARVNQAQLEAAAAAESKKAAELAAGDSELRLGRYLEFDQRMDELESSSLLGGALLGLAGLALGGLAGTLTGGAGLVAFAAWAKETANAQNETTKAGEERALEKYNLGLAVIEAQQSAKVAEAQLAVATAGIMVAALQREAALLRHEFAIQNLNFLRNRILNAEQWQRLAATIRSVSDTYLRYAIELAFLAEQSYEFEADKRLNVIRFDYDQSEVGDFLAADFLLRDLDTLEQDLIVSQRQRQQQVRYVLSMAREFPEALRDLRDNGVATFSLPLEQLERRFPGLFNLRIGAVDVLPLALMDSTRFSLQLTYQGSSTVRLKASAATAEPWATTVKVGGPETTIFSGLSRQDASAVFPFASIGQRNAFEGLGAACAWKIDMSMKENQVVPGSLADLLITFTLSGYYDSDLRTAIEQQQRQPTAVTRWLSARQTFPDAFYDFNRTGKMEWNVSRELLTLTDSVGTLRNIGVMLVPAPVQAEFTALMTRYQIEFEITAGGDLKMLSEIPQLKFDPVAPAGALKLKAKVTAPAGATFSWSFGDGGPPQTGATVQHAYDKPGKYQVTSRIVRGDRLSEYRASISISRDRRPTLPLTVFPSLTRDTNTNGLEAGRTRVAAVATVGSGEAVTSLWTLRGEAARKGDRVTFDLKPGSYSLNFTAIRTLQARAYCTQRFTPDQLTPMQSLTLASNRTFDVNGQETTGTGDHAPANPFTNQLFNGVLSPVDDWVLELRLAENPSLRSVDFSEAETFDMGELQDVFLALEYESKPE